MRVFVRQVYLELRGREKSPLDLYRFYLHTGQDGHAAKRGAQLIHGEAGVHQRSQEHVAAGAAKRIDQ